MKSLKIIQVLAKIGRILSKIIFIFCIIGFCGCAVGLVCLGVGLATVRFGGFTLEGVIEEYASMSMSNVFGAMVLGMIYCAAEAVLSKFAEIYFRNELTDGTPFTHRGAKELLRLGILALAIPTASSILCAIATAIASRFDPAMKDLSYSAFGSFGLGIMMIFTSLICRYGADQNEAKTEEKQIRE